MGPDPVDPGKQLAHLLGVILDLLDLIEVADATGVSQNVLALAGGGGGHGPAGRSPDPAPRRGD